jgi:hypothetical protein
VKAWLSTTMRRWSCALMDHDWSEGNETVASPLSSDYVYHGQIFWVRVCKICGRKERRATPDEAWKEVA